MATCCSVFAPSPRMKREAADRDGPMPAFDPLRTSPGVGLEPDFQPKHKPPRGKAADSDVLCFTGNFDAVRNLHFGLGDARTLRRRLSDAIGARTVAAVSANDDFAIRDSAGLAGLWNGQINLFGGNRSDCLNHGGEE